MVEVSVSGKAGTGGTLVDKVAQQLAALSLEREEGGFLGAEDDLLVRLGVSRPTLRQAAKIAESQRMISIRRGTGGGFYAARPGVQDAIGALNQYLRLQGATLKHLAITNTVTEEAVELAAGCTDGDLRDQLRGLLAEVDALHGARAVVNFDTRFFGLIGAMCGNPVAELLIAMFYSFGRGEQDVSLYSDDRQQAAARGHFHAIGEAVLAGDGELARFLMRRRLREIRSWIGEPRAGDGAPPNTNIRERGTDGLGQ